MIGGKQAGVCWLAERAAVLIITIVSIDGHHCVLGARARAKNASDKHNVAVTTEISPPTAPPPRPLLLVWSVALISF